jgi:hypothetical protein
MGRIDEIIAKQKELAKELELAKQQELTFQNSLPLNNCIVVQATIYAGCSHTVLKCVTFE